MATYQDLKYLKQKFADMFDITYKAGEATEHEGIYRCGICGKSIVSKHREPLPDHQHENVQNVWRLLVSPN